MFFFGPRFCTRKAEMQSRRQPGLIKLKNNANNDTTELMMIILALAVAKMKTTVDYKIITIPIVMIVIFMIIITL